MNALVLSGGGANGAYQAGAISALSNNGFSFDIVAGVSVGALNGAMVAQHHTHRLRSLWTSISRNSIYKGNWSFWKLLLLQRRLSIYSTKPLKKLLYKEVNPRHFQSPDAPKFLVGVANFNSGRYISFNLNDPNLEPYAHDILLASASIPIAFPPVNLGGLWGIDGGTLNNNPMADVLAFNPSSITIINCRNSESEVSEKPKSIPQIAKRSIAIMMDDAFAADQKHFHTINNLVGQAHSQGVELTKPDGTAYKSFFSLTIEPEERLGSSLDFNPDRLKRLFSLGESDALRVLKG